MTDEIKVPVSAPGATKAATDIDKATEAARRLIQQKVAFEKGQRDFNDALAKEAKLLDTQVTPALKKAREEAKTYNALMNAGMLRQGRSFLNSSSLAAGGSANSEIGLRGMAQSLSRIGGPVGQVFQRLSQAAGAGSVALGGLTAGAFLGAMALRRFMQAEERRLDNIEKETKLRLDLNKSLEAARTAQQDQAKNTFESVRDARRFIAARSGGGAGGAYMARGVIARLEEEGDPAALQSMAKFLRNAKGHWTPDDALRTAKDISSTGAYSLSGALDAMAESKGRIDVDKIVAKGFGRRGGGDAGFTQRMRDNLSGYWEMEGFDELDEERRQIGAGTLRNGRDANLVGASLDRELKQVLDPVGMAGEAFRKALNDNLEPLRARAAAENEVLRVYKESGIFKFLLGTRSENEEYDDEARRAANVTR